MEDLDPEKIKDFHIPENLMRKLYSMTGDSENNRGFILAYVSQNGKPMVFCKSDTQIIEMGLRKALEEFLLDIAEKERTFEVDQDEEQ
tara:strand:+ start:8649 stop:8912 length:264 start_codon:yes stop_codon:yes gene_type:complete